MPKKTTKAQSKKERNPAKFKEVLKEKGYSGGKAPNGKEAHHKKPVAKGGNTTKKNVVVIPKAKHRKIHKKG